MSSYDFAFRQRQTKWQTIQYVLKKHYDVTADDYYVSISRWYVPFQYTNAKIEIVPNTQTMRKQKKKKLGRPASNLFWCFIE